MGWVSKGSFDLAKLEPAISRHPSGRISTTRGFLRRSSEPHSERLLTIYQFMKPTPQITDNQRASFPVTDYNFQPIVEARMSSGTVRSEKKLRALWKVSIDFFVAEATRDYLAELLFFVFITATAAWPIIFVLHAITRMVRNY
jgi:hypothetical protein